MAELVGQRLVERQRPLLVGRPAVAAQRGLRARGDLGRERDGGRACLAGLDEAVGEPHALRLVAADAPAGDDQVERVAVAEQPRQADRPAVHQRDAPAPTVDAEHRVAGGDAQVAPRRELEAAGHRVALDRRDHRLGEQHAGRADRAVAVGLHARDALGVAGAHRLEVGARAERAVRAGEHRDGEVVVGLEAAEGGDERVRRRPVDGVRDLRPVDRDDRDRAVGLEVDGHYRSGGRPGSVMPPPRERRTR